VQAVTSENDVVKDDPNNQDALWTELSSLTGWSSARWQSIKSMPPELQQAVLAEAQDADWSNPSTPLGQKVLGILGTLGIVSGRVGSVAGAAGAIKTL
jgi:hypothetical protein